MATRRFCDLCNAQLTPADDQPFIRVLNFRTYSDEPTVAGEEPVLDRKATAFVAITNENNHALTDICNGCKLKVVNKGEVKTSTQPSPIATLQPSVAADATPTIPLYAAPPQPTPVMPDKPPTVPTPPPLIPFERSDKSPP